MAVDDVIGAGLSGTADGASCWGVPPPSMLVPPVAPPSGFISGRYPGLLDPQPVVDAPSSAKPPTSAATGEAIRHMRSIIPPWDRKKNWTPSPAHLQGARGQNRPEAKTPGRTPGTPRLQESARSDPGAPGV